MGNIGNPFPCDSRHALLCFISILLCAELFHKSHYRTPICLHTLGSEFLALDHIISAFGTSAQTPSAIMDQQSTLCDDIQLGVSGQTKAMERARSKRLAVSQLPIRHFWEIRS